MRYRTAAICRRGGRRKNEDSRGYMVLDERGCWVVADGLGGYRAGEVASRLAVETIVASSRIDHEVSPGALEKYLQEANQTLLRRQKEDPDVNGMRTTTVVLVAQGREALWAHVGDSRLYHFRQGRVRFCTIDHSVPQSLVEAGDILPESIRFHSDRHRLLRVLGKDRRVQASIETEKQLLEGGDALLLCTDGFWELVYEAEMEVDFVKSLTPEDWLEKMEIRLFKRANGHHDNYTAVGVFVEE